MNASQVPGSPPPSSAPETHPVRRRSATVGLSEYVAELFSLFRIHQRVLERRFRRRGFTDETATLENGVIRYWDGGQGPVVLLLHGFGADAVFTWHAQIACLQKQYRVIVPDLLWFGGSHSTSRNFSVGFQAEALIQLLDHLGVHRSHLVGLSYGGFVAMEMVDRFPERANRLVVIDSPGPLYDVDDYQETLQVFGLNDISELVIPQRPEDIPRLMRLAWRRPPPLPSFVCRDVYRNMFLRFKEEKTALLSTLWEDKERVNGRSWSHHQPTMVIWGENDPLFPMKLGERLVDAIGPSAHLAVIPGASHTPNIEKPRPFNAHLCRFLAAND